MVRTCSSDTEEIAKVDCDTPPRKVRSLKEIYELSLFAFMVTEPTCYEEACGKEEWEKSMQEEMTAVEKNHTWELVNLPQRKEASGVKWVYKVKCNADGSVQRYKGRLVAKGYVQKHGIDFFETFSHVARFETIRLILALIAHMKWKVFQFDVKSAFLNGTLEEDVYVQQPQGFVISGQEGEVYKLKKALYSLKKVPRAWYGRLNSYLHKSDFHRSKNEPTLYVKVKGADMIVVCIHVDDIIYTGSCDFLITEFKNNMMHEFEMSDLGLLHFFLGLQVVQTRDGVFISQEKYASDMLNKYNMLNCNASSTPINANEKLYLKDGTTKANGTLFRGLVGGLLYLTHTRLDILFAVSLVFRFMHTPSVHHFRTARHILYYIQATSYHGIWYKPSSNFNLLGFTDSDQASSVDDRKSTGGFIFQLGSGAVSWSSKKQSTAALSSSEAEYVAASSTTCQAIWMRQILEDLGQAQAQASPIYYDNKTTIAMTKNPICHGRTKHIELHHHFIRDAISEGGEKKREARFLLLRVFLSLKSIFRIFFFFLLGLFSSFLLGLFLYPK